MEVRQSFDSNAQAFRTACQQMTTVIARIREEVEVVAGNAERTGESGRPKADQRSGCVGELEFFLSPGGIDEPRIRRRWRDCARLDSGEDAVEPHSIED